MAELPGRGIFLEKRSYQRRRAMGAIKLTPVLGAWLFLLPILWPKGDSAGGNTMSSALIYIFVAWCVLIVGNAILVARVGPDPSEDARPPNDDGR